MGKDDIGHVYPFPKGDVPLRVENIYSWIFSSSPWEARRKSRAEVP